MSRSSRKTDDLQLPLWNEEQPLGVINVASIPQRSVFRYPGVKTWLVPYIRKWLVSRNEQPAEFIEPFAGGGIVGLSVAFENLAKRVTLVELDQEVAAVWHTLLSPDAIWLAERIVAFDLSSANVEEELARPVTSTRARAFRVILQNPFHLAAFLASLPI